MRYLIILAWSLILGQMVAFLGAALNHGLNDFSQAVMGSIVIALFVIIIGEVSQPSKKKSNQ